MIERKPLVSERVRKISDQSFAFIPHRFLRDGFFASLSSDERSLYMFLVLASDRLGVSFYSYDRICSVLGQLLEQYLQCRNSLIAKDLIAFDGRRFQVLSLPEKPRSIVSPLLTSPDKFEEHDPATIRQIIAQGLGVDPEEQ
jgi:hypothetical protein